MPSKDLSFILLGEDRSASRVMSEAASNAEKATGRIGGAFTKVGGIIGGEFGNVLGEMGEGVQRVGEKSGKLSSALLVGGGVATGMGVALTTMGSGHKQAADQLEQAVKNSGKSMEDYRGQFDKVILKQQGFGRSAIDTQEALRKLTTSTNDPKKAIAEMGLVSDLAAAKHISLSEAADTVSKVLIGKGAKALTQFGIVVGAHTNSTKDLATAQGGLTKATTTHEAAVLKLSQLEEIQRSKKTLSVSDHIALQNAQTNVSKSTDALTAAQQKVTAAHDKAKGSTNAVQDSIDALTKKVDGQAAKSVDNFGAQVNIARVKLTDWGATMGEKVGPVLSAMGPALMVAGAALDIFRARQVASAAATVAQAVATDVAAVATDGAAVSQVGLNLAWLASPITIIILAVVALVGALVFFFTQTKLGQDIFKNVMGFITAAIGWVVTAFQNVVGWVVKNWPLLLGILGGPIGLAVAFIITHLSQIQSVFKTVFAAIGSFIGGVFNTATSIVRGAINIMIDLINGIIKNINGIGSAIKSATGGAIDIKLGTIPRLATGGVTNGPMLAVIGDNPGGREIVQPLSAYKADLAKERAAGTQSLGGKAAQGGFYIDKFITQAGQSPQEIAANLGWMGRWAT